MRSEVEDQLRSVLANEAARACVAKWARRWIEARNPDTSDAAVWKALVRLVGADWKAADGSFQHGEADFQRWLGELRAAPSLSEIDRGDS